MTHASPEQLIARSPRAVARMGATAEFVEIDRRNAEWNGRIDGSGPMAGFARPYALVTPADPGPD